MKWYLCIPVAMAMILYPAVASAVSLTTGELQINLKQSHGWMIRSMTLDGKGLSDPVSANGTVIRDTFENWYGSGHHGITLNDATLTVDGTTQPLDESASYAGNQIVLTRDISYADNDYAYTSTTVFEPNKITENVQVEGTGGFDAYYNVFYGYLQSYSWKYEDYFAYDAAGNVIDSGTTSIAHGDWIQPEGAVAFRLHNPYENLGVVVKIESDSTRTSFALDDRLSDNKLYFRTRDMEFFPTSRSLDLTSITAFYTDGDTASYQTAMSLIPEPASAAIVFGMALPLLARRRR